MVKQGRAVVVALASVGGLGYVPVAPGTFGTLAALPLWWLAAGWSAVAWAAFIGAVCVGAVLVSVLAERAYEGAHDVQHIVIDEVAGMLVASWLVPFSWPWVLAAFVLFRLLDALKPWPISWLDESVPGGLGVVIDDVAAGVVACGCLHLAHVVWTGLGGGSVLGT